MKPTGSYQKAVTDSFAERQYVVQLPQVMITELLRKSLQVSTVDLVSQTKCIFLATCELGALHDPSF